MGDEEGAFVCLHAKMTRLCARKKKEKNEEKESEGQKEKEKRKRGKETRGGNSEAGDVQALRGSSCGQQVWPSSDRTEV